MIFIWNIKAWFWTIFLIYLYEIKLKLDLVVLAWINNNSNNPDNNIDNNNINPKYKYYMRFSFEEFAFSFIDAIN